MSLWILGGLSYISRNVPRDIWDLIKKHSTTNLTILNSHESYHNLLKWIIYNNLDKNVRYLKISNGRWGDDEATKSIGYGNHYFFYMKTLFKINIKQQESHARNERDIITITKLGRGHRFFNRLFEDIKTPNVLNDKLKIRYYMTDYWHQIDGQPKRDIENVFLDYNIKEQIIDHISQFRDNEQWYIEHGIPYQLGILLYGPPGTGKTSLIKAIASHFNLILNYLPVTNLSKIEDAVSNISDKSLLVIEDIDSEKVTHNDLDDKNNDSNKLLSISLANISSILNSVDGVLVSNGRILIATTNHKEKLNDALIRDGRFDLKIEIGFVTVYILTQFFKSFYPNYKIPNGLKIKSDIAPATLQKLIIKNLNNPDKVLDMVRR